MEALSYAERKSRLIHQKADAGGLVWRAVGSVTIFAQLDKPLFLEGVGYTVFFQEAKREGELRDVVMQLERVRRSPSWWAVYWCAMSMLFGAAVTRAWYLLF